MAICMNFGRYRFVDVWRTLAGDIPYWNLGGNGDRMKVLCALEKGRQMRPFKLQFETEIVIRQGTGLFLNGWNVMVDYKPNTVLTVEADVPYAFVRIDTDTIFIQVGKQKPQKNLRLSQRQL